MTSRSEADDAAIEATKAPLLDHLIELRKRLVISIIAFIICFVLCFTFAKYIYAFLTAPLAHALAGQPNHHLIYTALYETFFTYVKLGMFAGLCLSFPIIASQLWLFIAPGLYRHERNAFLPFLAATPVLFPDRRSLRLLRDAALRDPLLRQLRNAGWAWHAGHRAAGEG